MAPKKKPTAPKTSETVRPKAAATPVRKTGGRTIVEVTPERVVWAKRDFLVPGSSDVYDIEKVQKTLLYSELVYKGRNVFFRDGKDEFRVEGGRSVKDKPTITPVEKQRRESLAVAKKEAIDYSGVEKFTAVVSGQRVTAKSEAGLEDAKRIARARAQVEAARNYQSVKRLETNAIKREHLKTQILRTEAELVNPRISDIRRYELTVYREKLIGQMDRLRGVTKRQVNPETQKSRSLLQKMFDKRATTMDRSAAINAAEERLQEAQARVAQYKSPGWKTRGQKTVEAAKESLKDAKRMGYKDHLYKATGQAYNRILKKEIEGLPSSQRKRILQGGGTGKLLRTKVQKAASEKAAQHVKNLRFGIVKLPKNATGAEKKIYGTMANVSGRKVRVQPTHKGGFKKSPSQTTQRVGDKQVIVRSSRRRIAERAEKRAARSTPQARAQRAERHAKAIVARQQRDRARGPARSAKTMTTRNVAKRDKATQIQRMLATPGFNKTLNQVLREQGMTKSQYRHGLSMAGKGGEAKLGKRLTPQRRRAVRKVNIAENRFPAMRHSSPNPTKPTLITDAMHKKLAGGKQKVTRLTGVSDFKSVARQFGAKPELYSTHKTMPVPGRSFGTQGRGLMMGMDLLAKITINGERVIANATTVIPRQIKKAIIGASDHVGRKMLDIIEPYVPKCDGYMYMSARTETDRTSRGMVSFANNVAFSESENMGVTISYNTPYAEMVYFDESKRHGKEYNQHYKVQEKGEKETARWIERAMEAEPMAFRGLLDIYVAHINTSLQPRI
jgi:hypothetical protein